MVHVRPTFLATLAALGLVAACTSNDDATDSSSSQLSFTLEGDGNGLALKGSPADTAYRAHYPLAGLTRMIVSVNGTGDLTARCESADGPVKCREMPFFSKVTRIGQDANHVTVYDIYGHAVIGTECAPGAGNGNGSGTGSGSASGSGAGGASCDGGACSGGGSGYGSGSGSAGGCTGGACDGGGGSGWGDWADAGWGSGCTGSDCLGGGGGGTGTGGGTATGSGSGSCSVNVSADCSGCSLTVGSTSCGCSDVQCVSGAIASCAGASGGGGGSWTGGTGSGGSGGSGSGGGGCTTGACGGGGSDGGAAGGGSGYGAGGGATCASGDVDKAKDQFCADIQTWLDQHHVAVTFDCSTLGDAHYAACMPPPQHEDYRCMDIVNAAWTKVRTELATCTPTEYINWESSARWELLQKGACRGSPLVLDLAGDGVSASSLEDGVGFDLFGDGHKVKTAWVGNDDAFLAIDANGDGRIDGAKELFGNATFGHRYEDGFSALAELDGNHDGRIDDKDPAYGELLLWRDANHDGVAQASELQKLRDAGVRWLSTSKVSDPSAWDAHGNDLSLQGTFGRSSGTTGQLVDVYLRFAPKP